MGATVVLGCRNTEVAAKIAADINTAVGRRGAVVVGPPLDLFSQESVSEFAAHINKTYPHLHILVNNAGVSFMKKCFTPKGVGGIAQVWHSVKRGLNVPRGCDLS